jgi:hypothetical protein
MKFSRFFSSTFLIVLLGYLSAELVVRYFVPGDQYPTGHWRNNELKIQTSQLEKLDTVDVMFTGSSLCSVNILPMEFDVEMKKNGINIISFNAGIRGCDYEGVAEGFKKLFWSRKKSEYIVLVVSPWDLDELNKGVRNRSRSFIKTFNTPKYEAVVIDFLSNSWFFGFRNEIKDYFKTGNWRYEYPLVGARGNTPMYREPNLKGWDWIININKKDTIAQSLFNLINFLVKEEKKVIIIEALHISPVKEKIDPDELRKFYNIFKELDKIKNTIVLDTHNIIPEDKYFIDAGHLSVKGAQMYSHNLAQKFIEAGFPWGNQRYLFIN